MQKLKLIETYRYLAQFYNADYGNTVTFLEFGEITLLQWNSNVARPSIRQLHTKLDLIG
ncbi:MAG: hypothetical protein ACYTBZ_02430 [Planctomycetota bacterium]